MKPAQLIVLCEDKQQGVFVRRWVWLFFVGGPERFMGLLRAAWQELLNPSKAG